ncbi:MAG: sugar transferase [Bacteroidales bacterium]|jgi:exopolysaccharide biosynthesis polyprenyl glycosylphosphotransferase|nr:sugar transferase [Bacteroidales bacterium]
MNKKKQVAKYVIADLLSAALAWSLFFLYRKSVYDPEIQVNLGKVYADANYYVGVIIIPLFWLALYAMAGTYRRIYRKSRLKELGQTLIITIIGIVTIFFALILDDIIISYKTYYHSLIVLFVLHFGFTYTLRLIITSHTAYKIHHKIIGFNTLIIGSNENAVKVYTDIENQEKHSGNKFIGFINVEPYKDYKIEEFLPHLGSLSDLKSIVQEYEVEEVIIAIERSEHKTIEMIITQLQELNVIIKIIPDMQDFLLGTVKVQSIFHTPLIQISPDLMPPWQQSIKRAMDVILSLIAMIVLIPFYVFTAIGVKLSSKGPIIYSQERIGLHGKPFRMHKFRSMYSDAEKGVPMLSSKADPRITTFGRFMRKVRLDEIPQFYSVLIGDMSLVGPRPERQYYIDQIVQRAPQYMLLQKVKPGITSWGQVKFGYAENVDEMIERLKYDILYIENMSIAMDIKIMIYTVLIVVTGRGK